MFVPSFPHTPFLQTDIFNPFPKRLEFLVILMIINLQPLLPVLLKVKWLSFLLTLKQNHCPYDLVLQSNLTVRKYRLLQYSSALLQTFINQQSHFMAMQRLEDSKSSSNSRYSSSLRDFSRFLCYSWFCCSQVQAMDPKYLLFLRYFKYFSFLFYCVNTSSLLALYLLGLRLQRKALWLMKIIFSGKSKMFFIFLFRNCKISALGSITLSARSSSFSLYCSFLLNSGSSLLLLFLPLLERYFFDLKVLTKMDGSISLSQPTQSRGNFWPDQNYCSVLMERICCGNCERIIEAGNRLLGSINFLRMLISSRLGYYFSALSLQLYESFSSYISVTNIIINKYQQQVVATPSAFLFEQQYFLVFIMSSDKTKSEDKIAVKYYKCITREDDNDGNEMKDYVFYKYTLHSFAKQEFYIVDIYRIFFGCIKKMNKEGKPLSEKQDYADQQVSIFFTTFCRHVFLHFLLTQEERDEDFVNNLTNEMVNTSNIELSKLVDYLKRKFTEMADVQALMNEGRQRSFDQVQQILQQMGRNIDNLIKSLEDEKFQPRSQWMPSYPQKDNPSSFYDKKIMIPYVKRLFDRIRNIHLLRRSKKMQMLKQMQEQYSSAFFLRVQKDQKKEAHQIYMIKNTMEREPILIMLPHYLKSLRDHNFHIKYAMAQDVVKLFSKFLKETKRPFPNLKMKSLLFNQRKAEIMYDQVYLIFDGLGISGNTNSIELQIAIASTPTVLEYEKCHLEEKEYAKWIMIKKYYKYYRNEENERSTPILEDIQGQRETEDKSILEKIHVWRLLCVLYSIFNDNTSHAQLSANIYAQQYKNTAFYRSNYLLALEKAYSYLQSGKKSIFSLLNIEKMSSKNDLSYTDSPKPFNFTMNELCNYFQVQDQEDSMLQKLKYESLYSQLNLRIHIVKEINNIMNTYKYFSNMQNIKKYTITYYSLCAEFFYQAAFRAWLEERKRLTRKNFMAQSAVDKKFNLSDEKEKIINYIGTISKKLFEDYIKRKDSNRTFIINNPKLFDNMKEIKEKFKVVNDLEADLNQKEQMLRIYSQNKEFLDKYETNLRKVKSVAGDSFDICVQMLQNFCNDEICSKRNQPQDFHKIEEISKEGRYNKQLADIAIHQLVLLIQTFTRIRHSNWKVFDRFLPQTLIQRKNMNISTESIQKEQIEEIKTQLSMIEAKITEYHIQKLNFSNEKSAGRIST